MDGKTFANLVGKFGLLAVGAMKTENEWAFKRFEDSLADEHDAKYLGLDFAS